MNSTSPRKILLVLEATLGGTGRHIIDLADGLLSRGKEVHLVYSLLRADVQFHQGLAALKQKHPQFREVVLPITRAVTLSDLSTFPRMWKYVRKNGPFDVIHSHSTKAGFLARLLIGTRHAAHVYTPHGLMTQDPALKGFRRIAVSKLESLLARRSRAVIAVSQADEECAVRTGIPANLLERIPNGIDTRRLSLRRKSRDSVRKKFGISPDAPLVGCISRLCEQKRPAYLVEAFASLCRDWSGPVLPHLVIIGTGPSLQSLQQLSADLNVAGQITWAGSLRGEDYVCAFDVLGHTSSFEGFGYVFLEAMASGVPIVTAKVGGIEELGLDGDTGLVCDPWDPKKFAQLLKRLLLDNNLRHTLGERGIEVAERFDVKRMVDATMHVYNAVTSDVPQPRAAAASQGLH